MNKEFKATVQAIHFLLKNFGETNKLRLLKLIYFADKRHLIFGGRTITGDTYLAMKMGPAGSTTLNVLRKDERFDTDQLSYINQYVQVKNNKCKYVSPDMIYDQLSESDQKTLIKIGELFKSWSKDRLINWTHKYPEWVQFEQAIANGSKCEQIELVALFSTIENDPLGISKDIVEDSRSMYLGIED